MLTQFFRSFALSFTILPVLSVGQRITIVNPGPTIPSDGNFVVELQEGPTSSAISQISLIIAVAACNGGVCSSDDPASFNNAGQVLFNGPFVPAVNPNRPGIGAVESFGLTLPAGWPAGESALIIGHVFSTGDDASVQTFEFEQTFFTFTPES